MITKIIGCTPQELKKQRCMKKGANFKPDQKKEIVLDKGDRLITIANFNNLEMVNYSQWLHIL
jgi:hypothetical protein